MFVLNQDKCAMYGGKCDRMDPRYQPVSSNGDEAQGMIISR